MFLPRSLALCLIALASPCLAQQMPPSQSLDALTQAATERLKAEIHRTYPELQAQIAIRPPDPRLQLARCDRLDFSLHAGANLYGIGSIGVRCTAPRAWALSLGYQIGLRGAVVLASRPLGSRETIKARDVTLKETDLAGAPGNYLRDPQQAIGMVTSRPVQAGQALMLDMLHKPLAIRAGQKVRIMVQAADFTVSQECTAQTNALVGDLVRCKANNGRMLQGVATEASTLQIKP